MDKNRILIIYFNNGNMLQFEQVSHITIDYNIHSSNILNFKYCSQNVVFEARFSIDQIGGYSVTVKD